MTNKECIEYLRHLEGKEANQVIKALEENEILKNSIKTTIEILKINVVMFNTMGMLIDAELTEQILKDLKKYLPDIYIDEEKEIENDK